MTEPGAHPPPLLPPSPALAGGSAVSAGPEPPDHVAVEVIRQAAMRIAALAENGLTFSKNPHDLDRYKKLRDVAAELFALLTDRPLDELKMELGREVGYVTPKVEVRGALIDEGDRLLMMREVADGRWSLPGGFADPLDTPSEAVVREVREETGYGAEVMKLSGAGTVTGADTHPSCRTASTNCSSSVRPPAHSSHRTSWRPLRSGGSASTTCQNSPPDA